MSSRELIPSSSNFEQEKEPFSSEEMVQYNDGAVSLRFAGQGDVIAWGGHKYAQDPASGFDRTLVRTRSGNTYILGDGLFIDSRGGNVWDLRKNPTTPNITIGEQWSVPGAVTTTPVESVEIEYKIYPPNSIGEQVDADNPFDAVSEYLEKVQDAMRAAGLR